MKEEIQVQHEGVGPEAAKCLYKYTQSFVSSGELQQLLSCVRSVTLLLKSQGSEQWI